MAEEVDDMELEFMRKSRFEKIKSKFTDISEEAQLEIDKAKPDDILSLKLTFNSPVKVIEAEIFDEDKFINLAF